MTTPALIIKPTIRPRNRLSTALPVDQDIRACANTVDATARKTLVVETAVGSADGLAAAALRLGSGESGESDWWVG
jgi:hypothetical protein